MELLAASRFCKNVLASPSKTHLAVEQDGARLSILDLASHKLSSVALLNNSNSIAWFPVQVGRAGAVAVSSNSRPIVVYDAETAATVCQYVPFNGVEAIDAPLAVDFTADGACLVAAGFECLRVFDVQRPGSEHAVVKLSECRASRSGIKGRVSCLAVRQDATNLLAVGAFNNGLGMVDLRSGELLFQSSGAVGSVLQVAFSADGWTLFSYSRKDQHINAWDLRCMSIASTISRPHMDTSQRLHFGCLEGGGLAFGDCLGDVHVHRGGESRVLERVHLHPVTGVACLGDSIVSCCGDRRSNSISSSSGSSFGVVKTILN